MISIYIYAATKAALEKCDHVHLQEEILPSKREKKIPKRLEDVESSDSDEAKPKPAVIKL